MKITINNAIAAIVVAGAITFATLAVIHIIALSNAGLIHWNR